MFEHIETPALVLDKTRLEKNAADLLARAKSIGVTLRPHLKTAKSVDVARIATGGTMSTITVSTLKEAAHFAAAGVSDILYAVGISPNKFAHAHRITRDTGQVITLITDNLQTARQACEFARQTNTEMRFLIEIDCGEHRGGIAADDPDLTAIAQMLDHEPMVSFLGVMTHAGHSYTTDDIGEIQRIAEDERGAAVNAATVLQGVGIDCRIVSTGSTSTVLFGQSFDGLSEVRCGVYLFYDLAQQSRGICTPDQMALSVLASVIGHNRNQHILTVDAGAFALSKDQSANTFAADVAYGYVCDATSLQRLGGLSVNVVHQEHGTIHLDNDDWFDRLPIGSLVRILPNHACPTASAYDHYHVIENGGVVARWPRISGW